MYIPGSNNGTWGAGMHRALFPKSMGGALGHRGHPLPNAFQHPAPVVQVPYRGHAFGNLPSALGTTNTDTVYSLTPGGSTTETSWGWDQLAFGASDAARAMRIKHTMGIPLSDAWKIVRGETTSYDYTKKRGYVPCPPGYYRHSKSKRCRKTKRSPYSPKRKTRSKRKTKRRTTKRRTTKRRTNRRSRRKLSPRSRNQANAKKAMKLKNDHGISLKEAWSIVKGKKKPPRRTKRRTNRRSRKLSPRSRNQANAKKAMKLKYKHDISLKEAWDMVKRGH